MLHHRSNYKSFLNLKQNGKLIHTFRWLSLTFSGAVLVFLLSNPISIQQQAIQEETIQKETTSAVSLSQRQKNRIDIITNQLNALNHKQSEGKAFTATAFNLKGRMASGGSVRRGIVAADTRVLPLGTRIQISAGAYSGTYTVADTGGAVKGNILDIWMPTPAEKRRFGRRTVSVYVLGKNPAEFRNELEKERNNKTVTEEGYKIENKVLSQYEKKFYSAAAEKYVKDTPLIQNAQYSPNNIINTGSAHIRDLTDTMYDHIKLETDLARKIISQDEYERLNQEIVQSEKEIIATNKYNPSDVKAYEEKVFLLKKKIELVAQVTGGFRYKIETTMLVASPIILLLGILLSLYTFKRKEKMESEANQLQNKELKLKIVQLEQQISQRQNSLIIVSK